MRAKLIKIIDWFFNNNHIFLGTIIALTAGISRVEYFKNYADWIIYGNIILAVFQSILRDKDNKKNSELNSQLKMYKDMDRNFQQEIQKQIIKLVDKLFSDHSEEERISVFFHTAKGFKCVGRYSRQKELSDFAAREYYPIDQGCIGKAWTISGGVYFKDELPDPKNNIERWLNFTMEEFRIPQTVANDLRMKSRTYCAFKLCSSKNSNNPIAVAVYESLKPNLVEVKKVEELKKLINSKKSTIKKFCEWLEPYSSKHLTEGF